MKRMLLVFLFIVPTTMFADTFAIHIQASYQPEIIGLTPIPVIAYHPSDFFGWEFGLSLYFNVNDPDLSEPDWMECWSCFTLLFKDFGKMFYHVVSLGIKARSGRPNPLFGMVFGAGTELAIGKNSFLRGMVTYNCLDNNSEFVKDIQASVGMGLRL